MTATPKKLQNDPEFSIRQRVQIALLSLGFVLSFIWVHSLELWMIGGTLLACTLALIASTPEGLIPRLQNRGGQIVAALMAAFVAVVWVQAARSDIPALSILQAGFYSIPAIVMLLVISSGIKTVPRIMGVLFGLLVPVIVAGGIYELAFVRHFAPNRTDWPFEDANHLAMFLNTAILFSLALMMNPAYRRWGLILLGVAVLGALVTSSRGGMVGLAVGLAIFTLSQRGKWPLNRKQTGLMALGFIALLGVLMVTPLAGSTPFHYIAQVFTDPHKAAGSRPDFWLAIIGLIEQRWFTGYGTGTFPNVFAGVMTPAFLTSGFAAHNDFLQIWLELGVAGAALYLGIAATVIIVTIRSLPRITDESQKIQLVTTAAIMATIGVHAQIEFILSVVPLMLVMGIALGFWIQALPATHMPKKIPRAALGGQVFGAVIIVCAMLSLTQVYAEVLLRQSDRALARGDVATFAHKLDDAQMWSMNLHSYPFLRAAHYHLAILMNGNAGDTSSPDEVQKMINQALARNPYLSGAYEAQGRLDMLAGKSPLPAWQRGLAIEPRNAGIRLALLQYYERMGQGDEIRKLVAETRKWQGLRGPVDDLYAAIERF